MFDKFLNKTIHNQNKKTRWIILFSALGILLFIISASFLPFKDQLFSRLYPKPSSHASYVFSDITEVKLGNLTLNSTFNSIGIEVASSSASTAKLEFKKSSDTNWREGLPLWQAGGALYGSALLLDPGTAYSIKITPQGENPIEGSITTRVDNIPTSADLWDNADPNLKYYVRENGDDTKDGKSEATAWKTLEKAVNTALDNAVVQVGPGFFPAPIHARSKPGTFIAQYPAVSYDQTSREWTESNPDTRTVVEYGLNVGPWVDTSLTGPGYTENYTGAVPTPQPVYRLWKWHVPKVLNQYSQMGYAASRANPPQRIATWSYASDPIGHLASPAGFAEKLYTNKTYNYGFMVFPDGAGGSDIYLRMQGDANPNSLYITFGEQYTGFNLNAPDIRISGFEIRTGKTGVYASSVASRAIIDHNLFTGMRIGVRIDGRAPSTYATDIVVEYNVMRDYNLWSSDPIGKPGIPWDFSIYALTNADNSYYGGNMRLNSLGGANQSGGVAGVGSGRRNVIRYNHTDGLFDGIGGAGAAPGFDRYAFSDTDIYDNLIEHSEDDGFELDGYNINTRIWNNRVQNSNTFFSIAPIIYGPTYIFRNEGWRIGNIGATPNASGNRVTFPGAFKYDGVGTPSARVYIINNTFWTDKGSGDGSTIASGNITGGGGTNMASFYLRNNIFRTTGYTWIMNPQANWTNKWDEDYNFWQTSDNAKGMRLGNSIYNTLTAYQTASGQGAHSNPGANSFITPLEIDSALIDFVNKNLSLKSGSKFIDAGVVVPNISDSFSGSAPDLGAHETGSNNTTSAPTSFSFQTSNSYTQSQEIPVRVMVKSDTDSANLFVSKINFPANLLSVSRIDTAGSFVTSWTENHFDNTLGNISLVGGVPNPGYKTSGTSSLMATIYFTAKGTGVASLSYDSVNSAIYRNSDNINVLGNSAGTNINITSTVSSALTPTVTTIPQATLTPTSITTPTIPRATSTHKKGDFNKDGRVHFIDLSILLSHWGKRQTEITLPETDLNSDGVINTFDYATLIQILIDTGVVKINI